MQPNQNEPQPQPTNPFSDGEQPSQPQPQPLQQPPQPPQPLQQSPQFPASGAPVTPEVAKGKPKKGLIIGIVSAVVFVLCITTATLVYSLVYNNPDKAVSDALFKALTAKSSTTEATLTVESDSYSFSAKINASVSEDNKFAADVTANASVDGSFSSNEISVNLAGQQDELYIKVNDLRDLIYDALGSYASEDEIESLLGSLLDKVDGRWIVITADDLASLSDEADIDDESTKCVENQIASLKTDKALSNELMKVYRENQLFVVTAKGGDTNGNRYELTPASSSVASSFMTALKDTKFFKAIDDCVDEDLAESINSDIDELSEESSDQTSKVTIEVWVDAWSHNLNKISISGGDSSTGKMSLVLLTKFNNNPKVEIPTADTTYSDLETEINNLAEQYTSTLYDYDYDYDDYDYYDYDYYDYDYSY